MEEIKPIDFDKKLSEFHSFYDENFKFLNSAAEVFKTLISALLVDKVAIDTITYRLKEREECISKFKRKYLTEIESNNTDYVIQNHITDLVGLRVVCLHLDDIKEIQKLIESNFKEIDITDKSSQLDSTEDKFGYRGLHLDLMINDERSSLPEYSKFKNISFELQIRTIIQDAWSVLDHKIKYKKNIPTELKRRIIRLAALFEVADEEFLRIKGDTLKEQEKAKTEITGKTKELKDNIDVFKFLLVAEQQFPNYHFIEYKADGFVGEVLRVDPTFSTDTLINALENHKTAVEEYSASTSNYMNPYTIIRHCIYLENKAMYKTLLYESQRNAYEKRTQ
ncbi:MAG: (p)ppGpp synthetase [Bacteroidia bacterium]|nr:(p)ppGpp synthetase [Bacteroidia bacterium]